MTNLLLDLACPRRRRAPAAALAAAVLFGGCSTAGKVVSSPKSDVVIMSSTYVPQETLGKGPVEVPKDAAGNLMRYGFFADGKSLGYLLVLYPGSVKGTLKVPLRPSPATASTVAENNRKYSNYLDRLLRAHRLILDGDLAQARIVTAQIEHDYDDGYGTLVLKGMIALLEGSAAEASRYFAASKALMPGVEGLTLLEDGSAAGRRQ